MRILCKTSNSLHTVLFLNGRGKLPMIEQTRFLSTVFLCSEFKLGNIYSGVNFCGKNVCGSFYLRQLIFTDRRKNRKKFQK